VTRASRSTGRAVPRTDRHAGFEEEALPELGSLRARALRLTGGDEMRAADLVQETMLRAFRSWDGFETGTNVGAWLMTILRNAFISDYRRRRRAPRPVELDDARGPSVFALVGEDDPEGEFFHRIIDREVIRAIQGLPDDFRLPLVLSDLDGLSYGEIGERLDLPVGTVKSRLHRARRRLQHRLYDYAVEMGYVSRPTGADEPAARSASAG
jgi:RNA polymerase sigma-70 factor (ECF subfamily)